MKVCDCPEEMEVDPYVLNCRRNIPTFILRLESSSETCKHRHGEHVRHYEAAEGRTSSWLERREWKPWKQRV